MVQCIFCATKALSSLCCCEDMGEMSNYHTIYSRKYFSNSTYFKVLATKKLMNIYIVIVQEKNKVNSLLTFL